MELHPLYLEKLNLLGISAIDELSRAAAEQACNQSPEKHAQIWHAYWYLLDNPQPIEAMTAEEILAEAEEKKFLDEEAKRRAILLRGKPEIRGTQTIHEPGVVLSNNPHPDRPSGWESSQWWSGGQ